MKGVSFYLFLFCITINSAFSQKLKPEIIVSNKKHTKFWLINEKGERVSNKYCSIFELYIPKNDSLSIALNSFYYYSSKKKNTGQFGILRSDGKELTKDTLLGEFTLISPELFCLNTEEKATVFNIDGTINKAYSENLHYSDNGVLIKKKNNLFAVFNIKNEQLSDYIYKYFDTGDFLDRNPPVLVYMETENNEIHTFGMDGKIIKY